MKAIVLLETLLSQPDLDHDRIQAAYDVLPETARIADLRSELISQNVMSYVEIMNLFVNANLLPRSKTLLKKIETDRKARVHFKPETHQQKFHVKEEDRMISDVAFAGGALPIHIPVPELDKIKFHHSDEKQAVMLAVEMAELGELTEAEIVLLETLESFTNSTAAILVLCWVYLCTGHTDQSEHWAKTFIKNGIPDQRAMEFLCLAEQLQNKHLLASSHYQKLLQLKQVKSIWYLLMAYSLEKSNCMHEAADNYTIYTTVGSDTELKNFATQHLKELKY
jgi:hypothetical protein